MSDFARSALHRTALFRCLPLKVINPELVTFVIFSAVGASSEACKKELHWKAPYQFAMTV